MSAATVALWFWERHVRGWGIKKPEGWGGAVLGLSLGKKKGAIHAPISCASGLGFMAFLGHPKHARHPDLAL